MSRYDLYAVRYPLLPLKNVVIFPRNVVTLLVGRTRSIQAVEEAMARDRRIVFHGHDTWGMGVPNTLAAVDAGATMVDAALGGLGGCPFAPGASGNTSTEDVLFALQPEWLDPQKFHELIAAADTIGFASIVAAGIAFATIIIRTISQAEAVTRALRGDECGADGQPEAIPTAPHPGRAGGSGAPLVRRTPVRVEHDAVQHWRRAGHVTAGRGPSAGRWWRRRPAREPTTRRAPRRPPPPAPAPRARPQRAPRRRAPRP